VVADFLAEHPGVQADLTLHDRNLDLIEGELHVALRIGPLADSSLLASASWARCADWWWPRPTTWRGAGRRGARRPGRA
jgi:DNA-binding transcriptional LysR family regulator